jgi:hypothetical protein
MFTLFPTLKAFKESWNKSGKTCTKKAFLSAKAKGSYFWATHI